VDTSTVATAANNYNPVMQLTELPKEYGLQQQQSFAKAG